MYRLIAIIILLLPLSSCISKNAQPKNKGGITVAVASSLARPMQEIATKFETESSHPVKLSFASSGVFTAQIIHGAPFDVFVSANAAYPKKLEKMQKTVGKPQTIALGLLVLWSKTGLEKQSPSTFLTGKNIETLGIANPSLAPFGAAAVQWLKTEGIYEKVHSKLVYGENIGNVNQFITSGAIDAALTSISATQTPQLKNEGHWTVLPASQLHGIPHDAVIIKQNSPRDVAKEFLTFLSGNKAQAVFAKYGYLKPENQS